jgi:hypothetical protein
VPVGWLLDLCEAAKEGQRPATTGRSSQRDTVTLREIADGPNHCVARPDLGDRSRLHFKCLRMLETIERE